MVRNLPITWLFLAMLLISACGPDTIFLRPALDTPMQHVKNGHCLLSRGKIDAAHDEFQHAKRLDKTYAPAYVGLALVKGHRGDLTDGFETLDRARQLATTPEERDNVDQGFNQLRGMRP